VEHDDGTVPIIRKQDFECAGPVDISVELDSGRLDIQLEKGAGGPGGVTVQVRADPTGQPPWTAGIAGLLNWLGEQSGSTRPGELAAEAVRRTVIDFTGQRLTVRSPRDFPLRTVPLTIQLTVPSHSSITARSGSADITIDGVAGRLDTSTGSGQVRAQPCTGETDVRTGSGDVRLGSVLGRLWVRTGSGKVEVISIGNAAGDGGRGTVHTGSGDIRLGAVTHDVSARTGSGDVTVVDALSGGLELATGSGQLRVGIHSGVRAELDIRSGSGRARSDLPVGGPPAEGDIPLRVRARTGSGDALVTAAPSGPC
jgi:Putative adhesin